MGDHDERERLEGLPRHPRLRPYVERGLLADTLATAQDAVHAQLALDGELRPQVLVRDARGHRSGYLVELTAGDDRAELVRALHEELPVRLLELGARVAVLLADDFALALAHDPLALAPAKDTPRSYWAVGAAVDGAVTVAVAPAERIGGEPVAGEFVVLDELEPPRASVPAVMWAGLLTVIAN